MTHPIRLVEDLKKKMSAFMVNYWIFGLFHTTHIEGIKGVKGLLAATENRLIFFAKPSAEEELYISVHYNKIGYVESRTLGTASILCYMKDGNYMEVTFVSRGDIEGLTEFLQKKCGSFPDNDFSSKAGFI